MGEDGLRPISRLHAVQQGFVRIISLYEVPGKLGHALLTPVLGQGFDGVAGREVKPAAAARGQPVI
jgi:hypothetical protein